MRSEGVPARRKNWSSAAFLLLLASAAGSAQRLETEPTLPTRDLLPAGLTIEGSGYQLPSQTQLQGYLAQYQLKTPFGVIEAQGTEILVLRVAELPALARIDEISRDPTFADAIASSARHADAAMAQVAAVPGKPAKGIPAGIGRLLARLSRSTTQTTRNTDGRGVSATSADAGDRGGDFAREAADLNRARRELARSLVIDPYTGNLLLRGRLEALARTTVYAGLSLDFVVAALSGEASQSLPIRGALNPVVWEQAPADIRNSLERRLLARGDEARGVRRFLRTPAFTPTLQVRMVEALERLGRPSGEDAVLALAAQAGSEVHARFQIAQLEMLAAHADSRDPVVELIALQFSLAAETQSGVRIVSLPIDFLSYTEAVEEGTESAQRVPARLLVAGKLSRLAARELGRQGWEVHSSLGMPSE